MRLAPLVFLLASTSLLPACAGRLETTVRNQLGGTVRMDFRREGLVCTLDGPMPAAPGEP